MSPESGPRIKGTRATGSTFLGPGVRGNGENGTLRTGKRTRETDFFSGRTTGASSNRKKLENRGA